MAVIPRLPSLTLYVPFTLNYLILVLFLLSRRKRFAFLLNMFSVKDPVPSGLRAGVVYKFFCAGCSACYVGETTRHFSTRVREHTFSDRTSHVFKHLQNSEHCRTLCSNDCFSILDHASTTFQLKIKEAIHIQWEKPTLNHQLYHVNLKLSL